MLMMGGVLYLQVHVARATVFGVGIVPEAWVVVQSQRFKTVHEISFSPLNRLSSGVPGR